MDYAKHFNLTDRPFKNTYDRKYFYCSVAAEEIFRELASVDCPSVVHLKAEPRAGLTSLLRQLPVELRLNCRVALILNPHLTLAEIIRQSLVDFGQSHKFDSKTSEMVLLEFFRNIVNEFLADDFRVLLVVDNAAELSPDTLVELYGLIELEPLWKTQVGLLLGGSSKILRAVNHNIFYEIKELQLVPFTETETEDYLTYRLKAAGGSLCFNGGALKTLGVYACGLPEMINQVADRSLIAAWSKGLDVVGTSQVEAAVATLKVPTRNLEEGEPDGPLKVRPLNVSPRLRQAFVIIVLFVFSLLAIWDFSFDSSPPPPPITEEVVIFDLPSSEVLDGTLAEQEQADDLVAGVSAPSQPLSVSPPQLLTLPQGSVVLVVDQDSQLGRLWQGRSKSFGLKAEVAVPNFQNKGLYLFGRPRGNDPLIFQYPPSHNLPKKEARIIWPRIVNLLPQNIVPVIVASGENYQDSQDLKAKKQIIKNTKTWVQSQQYRVSDNTAALYASSFQFFELGQDGRTVEREDFRQALSSEALTSGEVDLTISEPLIMQDPIRKNLFWAMFNIKYESKLRNDMGIRVLIFEKSTLQDQWLIVAELWLPEKSLQDS